MQALACVGIYEGKKVTLSGGRVSFHCQRFANFLQAQGSEAASGLWSWKLVLQRWDLKSSQSVLLCPCSWKTVYVSKCVYMRHRTFNVQGQEQTIPKTEPVNLRKVLNKAQVAKGMCSILAYESAHMLCEFCKTFQQMPFKTFTQRKQTMSPRRNWYDWAFCCSAPARCDFSPLVAAHAAPQHRLLLSHLKAQTQSLLRFWCELLQRTTFRRKIWLYDDVW